MRQHYDIAEFRQLMATVEQRRGWDFSSMRDSLAPAPWDYVDVAQLALQ
ncbi:MAG: hypothetical protein ACRDQH_05435 [Pseudonocardiaceae bacterium]